MRDVTLRIQKNYDGEYRVAVFINGKFQEGPTYYTDDLDDAQGTMRLMGEAYLDQGCTAVHTFPTPRRKDWD